MKNSKESKVSIEEIEKNYESLRKKYKLPEFRKLNEDFDIEKTQDKETMFLLREMRREVTDKVAAFLRFFELFLNPQAAPLFILGILKNLSLHEKEVITKIYQELVALEVEAVGLDIEYSEKEEAKFILESFNKWQEMKPEMKKIGETLKKMQVKETKVRKSYFG